MKKNHLRIPFLLASAALLSAACDNGSGTPAPNEPAEEGQFQIVVAPWEADSKARSACYSIEVTDENGDLVWRNDNVCTDEFGLGDNGTLTYVSLCEASGTGRNGVSISLNQLFDDDGSEIANYTDDPPTFRDTFQCTRNADSLVRASFLVVTEGSKGFLDVQVTVQEIACNAKIDCYNDFFEGSPNAEDCDCDITDPDCQAIQDECASGTGTIVVGLACKAQGSGFAQLMLDDVQLNCRQTPGRTNPYTTIDVSSGVGVHEGYPNQFVAGAVGNAGVSADGTSFWTLAIAVDEGWSDCWLSTSMAASDGRPTDENDQFPIIVADEIDFGFDPEGVFACNLNPLDGEGSGLVTSWGSGSELDFAACLDEDGSMDTCE